MYITAQIIGIIALILAVISFQQKTHRYILAFQLAANIMFVIHFTLLGAYTGAVMNAIGVFRSLVFVNKGKAWADNVFWLYCFLILPVVVGFATWGGWASALPLVGTLCSTLSFWMKKPAHVRVISLASSPLWLVYNIVNQSYAGIMTEVINMSSIIIAIIRLDIKRSSRCSE